MARVPGTFKYWRMDLCLLGKVGKAGGGAALS